MSSTHENQIVDDGNVWTRAHGDVYTATNDNGDVIRALRSDLIDEER